MVDGSFDDVWITVYMQNWFGTSDQNMFTDAQFLRRLYLFFIRICSQCIFVQQFFNVSRTSLTIRLDCYNQWLLQWFLQRFRQLCSPVKRNHSTVFLYEFPNGGKYRWVMEAFRSIREGGGSLHSEEVRSMEKWFGFIKFNEVNDEEVLSGRLEDVRWGKIKIKINKARFGRQEGEVQQEKPMNKHIEINCHSTKVLWPW